VIIHKFGDRAVQEQRPRRQESQKRLCAVQHACTASMSTACTREDLQGRRGRDLRARRCAAAARRREPRERGQQRAVAQRRAQQRVRGRAGGGAALGPPGRCLGALPRPRARRRPLRRRRGVAQRARLGLQAAPLRARVGHLARAKPYLENVILPNPTFDTACRALARQRRQATDRAHARPPCL